MITRRDFVGILASPVVFAPSAAHTQGATKMRRIGWLSGADPPTDAEIEKDWAPLLGDERCRTWGVLPRYHAVRLVQSHPSGSVHGGGGGGGGAGMKV